jgi:hypothetical protein
MENTDTNFRSDVNDSCAPLDPFTAADKVNKHYYHLQSGNAYFNKWDSDFDGIAADSQMSCPACHNVHGPKLKDNVNYPDITHAPAMIRTGELIGREKALNLDYFTGSCPDLTARSATNELFDITGDSTGGRLQWYGGGRGWFTRNGVCIMCHNEGTPYWRTATEITTNYNTPAPDACDTCHSPNAPPVVCSGSECESCHGHDAGYEYDQDQYSWGLGNAASHSTHTENDEDDLQGPNLACEACHDFSGAVNYSPPNFISGTGGDGAPWDLSETNVCDPCHSPEGIYDGVVSTVDSVGAKDNWAAGVYDGNDLAAGMEKWCVGCHDDSPSVVGGVSAPNVAGNAADSAGFYNTGHGKHGNQQAISCNDCHDSTFAHVDGEPRTYAAAADNYQAGYRLKSLNGEAPMDVPRTSATTTDQFSLCFSCHDSTPFLTFDNTDTNFRSDVNDACVPLDPGVEADMVNKHWYHLRSGGAFANKWDSDWDGTTVDSQMSCPACHNVHGPELKDNVNYPYITHAPAMIRTGELIGRATALNLDYFTGSCPDLTARSATNELFDITGDSTGGRLQWYGGGRGWFTRNGVCIMCHNEGTPYWREAKDIIGCGNCHGSGSHTAHLSAEYDPQLTCDACHDTNNYHNFKSGTGAPPYDLSETDVCDPCHSPGGTYDGVVSTGDSVGAKDNWEAGVYDGSELTVGKENWCLGCHDDDPSMVGGVSAPSVSLFMVSGHGRANADLTCLNCHDATATHFDGEARTYSYSSADYGPSKSGVSYAAGYRLKYIQGEVPLMIPANYNITFSYNSGIMKANAFRLCFSCHDSSAVFDDTSGDGLDTNFKTSPPNPPRGYSYSSPTGAAANEHVAHVLNYTGPWSDSDWDLGTIGPGGGDGADSLVACSSCHNVHGAEEIYGSTNEAMIRDGSLAGRDGYGFSYVIEDVGSGGYPWVTSTGATKSNSVGAIFRNNSANMCRASQCHGSPAPPSGNSYNATGSGFGSYLEYYRQ